MAAAATILPEPATPRAEHRPSDAELRCWNDELEGLDADGMIRFAGDRFGARLAVATQFGVEGCTLLHRVARHAPQSYIFTIDTGMLFQETYDLADTLEDRFGITIHRVRPEQSLGVQAVKYAPNLWESDPDLCCTLRKVIPMQETLEGFDAWLTSVRWDQTPDRAGTPLVQWDAKFGLIKLAPYATTSAAAVTAYVREHDIPTNPLRGIGYPSLGCLVCTRPVNEGEDPRSGRWWGRTKTECGLHSR